MVEPTAEQIKEFWEWCGLKWFWNHNPECGCGEKDDDDSARSWHYFDGKEWKLATQFWNQEMTLSGIEALGYLFRYAVPKLRQSKWKVRISCGDLSGQFHVHLINWENKYTKQTRPHISIYDKDSPAIALFWAIYKIIDKESVIDG